MITSLTLLILSLVALYIGAGWLVQGSSALALKAKISPLVVGLTIVAFGTSAPELVVSLNATLSGQGDIAIGNIVGSNIFNIGVILGVSATICPLQVKKQLLRIEIPVMLATTVLFTILFWNGTLGRTEGLFFLTGIIIYTIFSLFYSRKQEQKGRARNSKNSLSTGLSIRWPSSGVWSSWYLPLDYWWTMPFPSPKSLV